MITLYQGHFQALYHNIIIVFQIGFVRRWSLLFTQGAKKSAGDLGVSGHLE